MGHVLNDHDRYREIVTERRQHRFQCGRTAGRGADGDHFDHNAVPALRSHRARAGHASDDRDFGQQVDVAQQGFHRLRIVRFAAMPGLCNYHHRTRLDCTYAGRRRRRIERRTHHNDP